MKICFQSILSLVCALVLLFAPASIQSICAADAAPPAAGATPAPGGEHAAGEHGGNKTVVQIFNEGGFVMWLLLLASILTLTFTVEGFVKLNSKKLAPPALVARLKEAISAGNYQEAWTVCKANPCFISAVLSEALERVGRGKDAVEYAAESASAREGVLLKSNVTYLSVIGVVTPMVGLTGTVVGMIKAFAQLGASGIGNPSGLAAAISEVLIATASGLVVAIPAFIFFYVLKNFAQGAVLIAEREINRMLEDIPYDQLSGIRIGENFSAAPVQHKAQQSSRATKSGRTPAVSQRVNAGQTSCPVCNGGIQAGTTPCPHCGAVLEWGS
ncbi:MAG: MotA/TolQ/ExbB proton channel family protein [Candidatus Methylacidiphilales bacterium]|nr:MotA/TolQ/ExbB proton channel family protein [Candidatus Methylacidiphilales bacterium]